MRPAARVLLTLCLIVGMSPVTAAVAADTLQGTLECEGIGPVEVEGQFSGNAFNVVGTTDNFVVKSASLVDPATGELSPVVVNKGNQKNLTTCSFASPESGRQFVFEGFFTPQGG